MIAPTLSDSGSFTDTETAIVAVMAPASNIRRPSVWAAAV